MPNITKVPAAIWIETAREALITEGLSGVKIDRLAKKLGVTRGGFYYHFQNHEALLKQLVAKWAASNDFLPDMAELATPAQAFAKVEEMVDRLIYEKDFSPAFELAIREWARVDAKVLRTVARVDDRRIQRLTMLFSALGCDGEEAPIRARVFYFHQIGYYNLGHHKRQSKKERVKNAPVYLRILCGKRYMEAASVGM